MARTHERSPSPSPTDALLKRLKTVHTTDPDFPAPVTQFAEGLFDAGNIQKLHNTYAESEPFKHATVENLFRDELLRNVKDECLNQLSFTEKETDIYKVRQTGDLASLSYLSPDLLSLLPSLLTLRDALYSPTFRQFIRSVTKCGPLSGSKQDMSVNSYTKGCHLLNHDDVIGTRRVSYILYMPLPYTSKWKEEWGGALELYPTTVGSGGVPEPAAVPNKRIPPSWNQFVFFEVQPGKSFHSVEEVVVGGEGDDEGRARLSISGWFHAAQEGEEGYQPETAASVFKSSREQLTSTSTIFQSYPDTQCPPMPDIPLTDDHISFLSEFLNPVYLQPRTMKALRLGSWKNRVSSCTRSFAQNSPRNSNMGSVTQIQPMA
jgi:Rps23 Pro-64 3,4-dihydroxylase Tpa1-like proline 4-hydroxylase